MELENSSQGSDGAIAVGDIDMDGDLDIVVGNDSGADRIYLNEGKRDLRRRVRQCMCGIGGMHRRNSHRGPWTMMGTTISSWAKNNYRTYVYYNNQSGGFDYNDYSRINSTNYAN